MKIQNVIRMSAAVIGLGAALMLSSSLRAQEIDNTDWQDGPNTAPMLQPVPTTTADISSVAANTTPAATPQEASLVQQSGGIAWLLPLGLVGVALIVVTRLLKAKRSSGMGGNNSRGTSSARLNTAA